MRTSSRWCTLALALACGLAAASPARAQQKEPYREGFWIGFGRGWGAASISCSECTSNKRWGSEAITIHLGGMLNKQLLLGGELNAWSRDKSGLVETVGDMSAVLYYYPSVTGTLFLKGGVGVVVYDANTSPKLESGGLGINVGVGIDLYVGRKFSLTPYASFVTALGGNLKVGGTDTGVGVSPISFRLASQLPGTSSFLGSRAARPLASSARPVIPGRGGRAGRRRGAPGHA